MPTASAPWAALARASPRTAASIAPSQVVGLRTPSTRTRGVASRPWTPEDSYAAVVASLIARFPPDWRGRAGATARVDMLTRVLLYRKGRSSQPVREHEVMLMTISTPGAIPASDLEAAVRDRGTAAYVITTGDE